MRLLIGAPVFNRAWVLPRHLEHALASCQQAGIEPGFVFVGGEQDVETWKAIDAHSGDAKVWHVVVPEPRTPDVPDHDWATPERWHRMVELRNCLLRVVRSIGPELFLSLDSDILVHRDTVGNLIQSLERFDAVGGAAYMSNGTAAPSFMIRDAQGYWHRKDQPGSVFPVSVIMAAKLMTPAAYHVDYVWSGTGEDEGWCLAAAQAGLKLGWDSRVINKHIMHRHQLDKPDPRYDW